LNNLTVIEHNGQLTVDSREVAEVTGKRHADLLRDIDSYWNVLENAKLRYGEPARVLDFFIPNQYESGNPPRKYRNFLLTRKGCDMVANKMTGEKGVLFTAAYVTKFEEMERKLKQPQFPIPQTYAEALRLAADLAEENQKLLPRAESHDRLMSADGLYSMKNAAKILNYKKIGPQNIFKVLVLENVLFKHRNHYAVYQSYLNRGYFKEKAVTFARGEKDLPYVQIFVTPKGLVWLDKFLEEREYEKNLKGDEYANVQG